MSDEQTVDPCEKCSAPVYGWIEERCCDGRECGCMGLPCTPCWCDKCWDLWRADALRQGHADPSTTRE